MFPSNRASPAVVLVLAFLVVVSVVSGHRQSQEAASLQRRLEAQLAPKLKFMSLEDAVTTPAAAESADATSSSTDSQHFALHTAIRKLFAYQKAHPDFAEGVATWFAVGIVLFLAGTIVFLFSEIKAVLVCRDQEFRKALHDGNYMSPSAVGIAELELKESESMKPRVYLTLAGFFLVSLGLSALMYPMCDILDIVGLPNTPCLLMVTFGAFFAAVVACLFLLCLVWSCTRPWAALVFGIISVTGAVMLPYGSPILVVMWIVLAFGGGWWYFKYLPEQYAHDERPFWFQDVGDLSLRLDDEEWLQTVSQVLPQPKEQPGSPQHKNN